MKSVIVYVEGPSDVAAMTQLLGPLIENKAQRGVHIQFFETPAGDRKASLIRKAPLRAAAILANDPDSVVAVLPDLYPLDKEVPHRTPDELFAAIRTEFNRALKQRGLADDHRYLDRFKTFCFKYDMEALLLSAESALASLLGVERLEVRWTLPVEDQDKDRPPKHIVAELFEAHGRRYAETVDAPLILSQTGYREIADACPQQFKRFVEFLESIES